MNLGAEPRYSELSFYLEMKISLHLDIVSKLALHEFNTTARLPPLDILIFLSLVTFCHIEYCWSEYENIHAGVYLSSALL